MAYQTGSATGPDDLLDKLRMFLLAQGWTVNDHSADGTGYRLHVEKAPLSGEMTLFFNFRSAIQEQSTALIENNSQTYDYGEITGILINGSTGYNAGNDWDAQPGASRNASAQTCGNCIEELNQTSIPRYWFFTVGDSVHMVVEVDSGHIQFMSFGLLVKQGVYTGGAYYSASYGTATPHREWESLNYAPHYLSCIRTGDQNGAVYMDVDGDADWRICGLNSTPEAEFPFVAQQRGNQTYSHHGFASLFWGLSPNFYNNIAAACPGYTFVKRSDGNYSLVGWPEGVRGLNSSLYSTAQEVVYGPDTWMVFEELSLDDNSEAGNLKVGFAFLKEV